jgi:hypothetical protein
MGDARELTEKELAAVFRRAAELDVTRRGDAESLLDGEALEQVAHEAGLSPTAVRQALAELRLGTLPVEPRRRLRRPGRRRGPVVIQRAVNASRAEVDYAVAGLLAEEKFRVRRRPGDLVLWERRERKKKSSLEKVRTVAVTVVEESADRSLVRVELEVQVSPEDQVAGGLSAAVFGGGGLAWVMTWIGPDWLALAGVPVAGYSLIGAWRSYRSTYRDVSDRARDAIELLLDDLDRPAT